MQEHRFHVLKTARLFSFGTADSQTKEFWIVCHGYRQLAEHFLRRFQVLERDDTFVLAPEGFHRFYTEGYSGRVGASWMTSEDRLADIDDYIHYLNHATEKFLDQMNADQIRITVVGFSQGAATVCRWLSNGKVAADKLILWAGMFPPDLDYSVNAAAFAQLDIDLVVGTQDEFITEERLREHCMALQQQGVPFKLTRFDGNHNIDGPTLLQLAGR